MATYVVLLRGINVGGARKVPMAELRAACEDEGWTGVRSYVQSGNLVLEADDAPADVSTRLAAAIEAGFGHPDVEVLVWRPGDLGDLVQANPFVAQGADPKGLHVTFLAEEPAADRVAALDPDEHAPDTFALGRRAVYVHTPNGYGRSKITNAFFEKALGVPATTRNWRTTTTLLAMTAP